MELVVTNTVAYLRILITVTKCLSVWFPKVKPSSKVTLRLGVTKTLANENRALITAIKANSLVY